MTNFLFLLLEMRDLDWPGANVHLLVRPPFSRVSGAGGVCDTGTGDWGPSWPWPQWCEGPRLLPAPTKAVRAKRSAERRPGPGEAAPAWAELAAGEKQRLLGCRGGRGGRGPSLNVEWSRVECGLPRQEHDTVRITLSTHSHWYPGHGDIRQTQRRGGSLQTEAECRVTLGWPVTKLSGQRDQAKPSGVCDWIDGGWWPLPLPCHPPPSPVPATAAVFCSL